MGGPHPRVSGEDPMFPQVRKAHLLKLFIKGREERGSGSEASELAPGPNPSSSTEVSSYTTWEQRGRYIKH